MNVGVTYRLLRQRHVGEGSQLRLITHRLITFTFPSTTMANAKNKRKKTAAPVEAESDGKAFSLT